MKRNLPLIAASFLACWRKKFPNVPIFAITRIWRKDKAEQKPFGKFERVGEIIAAEAGKHKNITVISGDKFIPEDEGYFADLRLHPNSRDFEHYFNNLYAQIKKHI